MTIHRTYKSGIIHVNFTGRISSKWIANTVKMSKRKLFK